MGSKRKFQLAAITAFYIAVKIYEPVVIGIEMLESICRGTYTESDIVAMENDILISLGWRVSGHMSMDYVRHLLELVPEEFDSESISDSLLRACQKHMDFAV